MSTKVSGKTTKWKAKAYSHGQMAGSMSETTSMIRRRVTECSTGQTDVNMMACGSTGSKTVLEHIQSPAGRQKQVSGRMGEE